MKTLRWFGVAGILLVAAVASRADPAIPRGQLPDDVRPERYRLELDIDPRQERFSGTARIELDVARPLGSLWLHGNQLDVSEVTVDAGATRLTGTYQEVEPVNGVARIDLSGELPAGRATLHIRYAARFSEGSQGLYRVRVGDDWYAFTQFQAIDARRAFPGFDEPRFKTPFEVSIVVHAGDRAITNAPLEQERPLPDGRNLKVFQATLPLPTYLLAFAVGPLDVVDAVIPANAVRKAPLPLRAVATRGKGPGLAYALEHTPRIVESLETYFGMPYPYQKLDVIASPQMAGAMENAGAIIFNDTLLLLDDGSPPGQQRAFYEIMAHEVAHHWFGDLVTPAWWDDTWLNESFAEWMGVKIADQLRPDLGIRAGLVDSAVEAMGVDSKRAGRPMHQAIADNSQISGSFDSITYQKGAGVLSMMESYLGEETFRRGVRDHLRRHEHGIATSSEFFAALSAAAQQPPVIEAFRSFVSQPGVPLVSVGRSADDDGLTLAQERYRPLGSTLEAGQRWKIPVCVNAYSPTGTPTRRCVLLAEGSGTMPLPAGTTAVMPNAGGSGYYRFALGADDLDRLLAIAPELTETEAIVLADSVAAVFRAGQLPFEQLLVAARQLARHPSRLAAIAPGLELVEIQHRWADAPTRESIARLLRDLYGPRLAELGLDVRDGAYASEPAERRDLRRSLASLVVRHGRDPAPRARLAEAARASLEDAAALDREFRPLAWTIGVQDLGDGFAASLESALLASQDSQLRRDAAIAIGAAESVEGSKRALALAGSPDLRTTERFALLRGQFGSPATRDAAWDWFAGNFDRLIAGLPGYAKDAAFGMAESFCDPVRRPEIERTLNAKANAAGSGALEVQRALEGIDLCVAQRAALGASVATALRAEPAPPR
jgi:aminopeptidase N